MLSSSFLNAKSLTKSISYDVNYGWYEIDVYFSESKSPISLIIDTGSSNFNVVGDNEICPNCAYLGRKNNTYSSYPSSIDTGKIHSTKYLIGSGEAKIVKNKIRLDSEGTHISSYQHGVYQKGTNIFNIWGFGFPSAMSSSSELDDPFFIALNKKFDFNSQFTLQLCDLDNISTIYFGSTPKRFKLLEAYQVPIIKKSEFIINGYGISSSSGKTIAHFPEGIHSVIDSGTTGKIVLPEKVFTPLVTYIKSKTTKSNRELGEEFWINKECVMQKYLNLKSFPTINFHFKNTDGKPIKLALPKERYITQSSCGIGYYRFGFINGGNNFKGIILGTPFLEQYTTTFKMSHPAKLIFYNGRRSLCRPKTS